jgi:hypothetical protein
MAADSTKTETPPYASYATFGNFINELRGASVLPARIDRHVLSKMSGSAQSALAACLKWLDLMDEAGVPTHKLVKLVETPEESSAEVLREILQDSYQFLKDGSIDLQKGTGAQLEARFREYGIQGSTVAKCIAFFILAAKTAEIPLGPYMRAPRVSSANGSRRKSKKLQQELLPIQEPSVELDVQQGIPDTMPGFVKIPIPLHGMEDGAVFLPDNMTRVQWKYALKITKFLIENYRLEDEDDEL